MSDDEELYPSDQPPPAYQDMMDGRIESHIVDHEMPPLADSAIAAEPTKRPTPRPSDNMWKDRRREKTDRERSRSPHDICTSISGDNRNSREVKMPKEGGFCLD